LALLRRLPPERVEEFVMPASEKPAHGEKSANPCAMSAVQLKAYKFWQIGDQWSEALIYCMPMFCLQECPLLTLQMRHGQSGQPDGACVMSQQDNGQGHYHHASCG
jgi:hypothetical protein